MRILLTGGSGFIGRNLVDYLRRSHEVLAPSRAELDLADPIALDRWFSEHDVDAVVHGALRPGHRNAGDTTGQLWTNLRMFFGLMRNAHRFGRLVFLSSGAVYDIARPQDRVAEEQLGVSLPADEHGLSKYVIAQYLDQLRHPGGADVVELRLFGVFGKTRGLRHPVRQQRDLQDACSTCRSHCARTGSSATCTSTTSVRSSTAS